MLEPVEKKAALILGGGGITGGVYELGVLSALEDFIVRGRRTRDFDIFVGVSAGSLLAAFLANGISVADMCKAILGERAHRLVLRREDIYDLRFKPFARAGWNFLRSIGPVVRYLRREGQPVSFLNAVSLFLQYLPSGFFSNANLERYSRGILSDDDRTNDFRGLSKELYIVATEIDTGERWVFGGDGLADVPISLAIQASSAIPVFFEPVRIREHYFVDGAAERAGHMDIPIASGADLVLMVNPTVPVYNDRTVVSIPTVTGNCSSITETGFANIAEQTFRINTRVKLELAMELHRCKNPETDILLLEPATMESTLFLYGSMNFAERVQILNYGYNSAAVHFVENFDRLRECFAKHGMEVSWARIRTDPFLELATRHKSRRRYAMTVYR